MGRSIWLTCSWCLGRTWGRSERIRSCRDGTGAPPVLGLPLTPLPPRRAPLRILTFWAPSEARRRRARWIPPACHTLASGSRSAMPEGVKGHGGEHVQAAQRSWDGEGRGSSTAAEVVDSKASDEEARVGLTMTHVARVRRVKVGDGGQRLSSGCTRFGEVCARWEIATVFFSTKVRGSVRLVRNSNGVFFHQVSGKCALGEK
jgi:hypothetical protein